jgi:uncharacterized protein YraI
MALAGLACNINVSPLPDTGAISTAAAQTIIASLTTGAAVFPSFTATNTSAPLTFTPSVYTPTLMPTQGATATPSITFTPLTAQISVSVATNCRSGPGKNYPRVGALPIGKAVDVYARDPSGHYWYIRNPDHANSFCWVWDEYATLTGSIGSLPVFTPPATATSTPTFTPTASVTATFTASPSVKFNVNFAGLEVCKARKEWAVEFTVKNVGKVAFGSMSVIVQDIKKDVAVSRANDGFDSLKGCNSTAHLNALWPGKSTIISAAPFSFNVKDRNLRAWIILCTQPGQGGQCLQKTLNFKP